MKTCFRILFALLLTLVTSAALGETVTFTDSLGREVSLDTMPRRVVSLYGSYAEAWLQCGGTLAGTTEDAISERGLAVEESTQIIGTVKSPSLELTAALEPDLILLSTDIASHLELREVLEAMDAPFAYFSVGTYREYMEMARIFCLLNERGDLYSALTQSLEKPIEEAVARAQENPLYGRQTALLLRAYSTGVKAKGSDNLAGAIMNDMGLVNIADSTDSLLENLSLEQIIVADPDYIFITTMGTDHEKAMEAIKNDLSGNPAWQTLSAVQSGRVIELPKDLFHYKPNARWAESYQMIGEIIYAP